MLKDFIHQVRQNCRLASGAQAGYFSLCGLLLRLRLLYKWEQGLFPWQEPEADAVLDWIARQESAWDSLDGQSCGSLPLNGLVLDPFEVEAVNLQLQPQGLAYGAGFTRGLAPTFFLGELAEVRREGEITVLVLGPELARDLAGTPALCQGALVYARQQALTYYLWDHLSDPSQQNNPFLKIALEAYQITLPDLLQAPTAYQGEFQELVRTELESAIRHEMGEAREESLRPVFGPLLEMFPQTRIELWLRGVKDALAEVNESGRLHYLIEARQLPSLALMLAWQPGLYPLLLPELEAAFKDLLSGGDWLVVEQARLSALKRLRRIAAELRELLESLEDRPLEKIREEIERRYLQPLGL
ncbi:MAG: Sfum_1244 family protein [Thermodesulfobacteriota bacterium]